MEEEQTPYKKDISKIRIRQILFSWSVSFVLIYVGYYLTEESFLQLEWLTRSGCLIVLIGVWSSISGIIQERVLIDRLNIQHRIELSRAKIKLRKFNAPKEYIEKEIDSIKEKFEDKMDELTVNVRFQLGMLEVSLLMTGTFIWGFGDLFFKINM
jgi:uncharacterized membrane protein YcjF (UPF0283 family)